MKKLFFFFLLAFSSLTASAGCWKNAGGNWPTAQAACDSEPQNGFGKELFYGGFSQNVHNYQCRIFQNAKHDAWAITGIGCSPTCPAGMTFQTSTGSCVCPAGQHEEGGVCVPDNQCASKAGTSAGTVTLPDGYAKSGNANSNDFLNPPTNRMGARWGVNGCEVVVTGFTGPCYRRLDPSSNGYYAITCDWQAEYTGNQSTDGPPEASPPPAAPNDNKCPQGTTNIGTGSDGGPICSGNAPDVPTDPVKNENKVTNPDGSTTTTTTVTTKNSDGSTTTRTTTTTTSADGKSTTSSTTTTTTPGTGSGSGPSPGGGIGSGPGSDPRIGTGSGSGSSPHDDSSEEGDDFCSKNPDLNICKNSNVSGISCSGALDTTSCDGDAIQCAILRQQRKEYCENQALKDKSYTQQGEAILAGNDPQAGSYPTPENAETVDVSRNIDEGGGGGGSCFQDVSASLMGQTITVRLSSVCSHLEGFRFVVMAIAGLAAFAMLSRSILG